MKIFRKTQKKVFSPEFGWLDEVKYKLFGITIMTERHFIHEVPKETQSHNIEEVAEYIEWCKRCQLPYIENSDFEKVLKKF